MYIELYDAISTFYKAKDIFEKSNESGGEGVGIGLACCNKTLRILSALRPDNDSMKESVQNRIQEAQNLKEELNKVNDNVYQQAIATEGEIPELELKNFAMLRSMEEELNKKFSGEWVSSSSLSADSVRIIHVIILDEQRL